MKEKCQAKYGDGVGNDICTPQSNLPVTPQIRLPAHECDQRVDDTGKGRDEATTPLRKRPLRRIAS